MSVTINSLIGNRIRASIDTDLDDLEWHWTA